MSDEIFFDGVKYISASEAGDRSNLSRDYIARLCRVGTIRGRRIGTHWYVQEGSLSSFLMSKEYSRSQRQESLSEERLREYHGASADSAIPAMRKTTSGIFAPVPAQTRGFSLQQHPIVRTHAYDVKKLFEQTLAKNGGTTYASASRIGSAPAGFAHAALAHIPASVHVPAHIISPLAEFIHKLTALSLAVMLTLGTYAFVDPQYARYAADTIASDVGEALGAYRASTGGGIGVAAYRAQSQLAAAAENPIGTFASIQTAFGNGFQTIARSVNSRIDDLVYDIAFPENLVRSLGIVDSSRARVSIGVAPFASSTASATPVNTVQSKQPHTVINQPVVERIVETQRILSAGGITEEILHARLQQLDAKLSAQMYGLTAANSSPVFVSAPQYAPAPVIALAQATRIDQLASVDISGSTWVGGSISGASISGSSVSATTLSSSGDTSLATTTVSGSLAITSGTASTNPFVVKDNTGTTVFAVANDGTLTTSVSSSTSSYSQLLITGSATATTLYASNLIVSQLASTTNVLTSNSTTTNATSTNLFSTLAHFTTGIIDALTATAATITGLIATNATTTNATSTNLAVTNLTSFAAPIAPYFTATSTSIASTLPYASTTAISGTTAQFTTASSTNLVVSGAATLSSLASDSLLYANASKNAAAASVGSSLVFSSGTLSLNTANANSWTALQSFANASSSKFSVFDSAYFGATATSSFSSAGALTLATPLVQGSGGTGFSSYTAGDILYADNIGTVSKLPVGSAGQVLKVQAGLPAWGTDNTGGGGGGSGSSMWATTTLNLIYPVDTSYPVAIGSNSTSTPNSIFEVSGQQYISSKLGIATTSPVTALSVGGNAYLTGGLGVGVFNSSAGTLQTSGAAVIGGSLTVNGLSGAVSASGGVLSAGTLAIANGGTGTTTAPVGHLLYGGSSAYQSVATSSLAVGSSLSVSGTLGYQVGGSNATFSLNTANANSWTALQSFANASSTLFSNIGTAYFGATATSSFSSAGVLTLAGSLDGPLQANAGVVSATTSIGLLYGGTGATSASGARTNLGAAALGANSDITSLSGLTTALSAAQGGTATTTWLTGGIVFYDGSTLSQGAVAADFFLDRTNKRLGVGTSTPWAQLSVNPNALGSGVPEFAVGSSTATHFLIDGAGKVGIGTTTPGSLFSIQNSANFVASATSTIYNGLSTPYLSVTGTSATSTFANGINLSGGCFAVNGTCVGSGGASLFTDGGATSYLTSTSDNLAVGTSTAYSKLSVWGAGTGTGQLFELTNSASTTIAKFLDNGTGYFLGNIGIGTTSPYRKLSLTDAVSTAQVAIAYDGTRYTEFLTNSVGDLVINPQGDDAFLNDDNLWVCTGGSCPSNNPTGTGNLVVENKLAIGTTTPDSKLVIETQDATTDFLRIASSTAQALLVFDERGYLGVGTSTPTKQFSIDKGLYVGNGQPSAIGTATSTIQGDLLITGKLDVSTIDPVYTIDGMKYATYGASTIGIREEMLSTVRLDSIGESGKYEYRIPFSSVKKDSDEWLFYQITDFGSDWSNLVVSLTPSFEGSVYYKKDIAANALVIYADAPGEISMRLSAYRYDFTKWGNVRPDQDDASFPGHVIDSKK